LSRVPFARLRQSWTTQRTRCSVASILTAFVNHAGFMCTLSFLLPSWKNKCCWCFLHSWLCDTFQLCSFCFFLRSNPFQNLKCFYIRNLHVIFVTKIQFRNSNLFLIILRLLKMLFPLHYLLAVIQVLLLLKICQCKLEYGMPLTIIEFC